jgi:hypothetical protein
MEDSYRRNAVGVRSAWSSVRAGVFAIFVSALAACGDSTGPSGLKGVTLTAPTTIHFTAEVPGGFRQIVVPVTITNSTTKPLSLGWCSQSLERISAAGWESVWSPPCLAILGFDPPIEPGTTRTISVVVTDTPPQYSGFRFTDPANVYRVSLELILGGDDGTAALSTIGASNVFEVVP